MRTHKRDADGDRRKTAVAVRLSGILAALMFLAPVASAAAPASKPPAGRSPLRDVELAVQARRVLHEDGALARLNLNVRVRKGVATLRGPVPSLDLSRQAVRALERLSGILAVRNELYVGTAPRREEVLVLPPPEPPTQSASASPDPLSGSLDALAGRRGPVPADPVARSTSDPAPPPVRLLAPILAASPPPAPAVPESGLRAAVERVRRANARFRAIRVEVRGTLVLVRGDGELGEDVMALAQALTQVPGVGRVVVGKTPPLR